VELDLAGAPVAEIARALLGARLVSSMGDERVEGVIVETEAYGGPEDPASHAATRAGRTDRNAAMFERAGLAYVYRIYGVHWCLNVVTGPQGVAQAVLVRGIELLDGVGVARRRRRGREPLTAGPGRVCEALGITGELDGHDLRSAPLMLLPGWSVPDGRAEVSGRIGVRAAGDWPARFYVRGSSGVSRGRAAVRL
jgi:DNA-3-methyladenine glycosylase